MVNILGKVTLKLGGYYNDMLLPTYPGSSDVTEPACNMLMVPYFDFVN